MNKDALETRCEFGKADVYSPKLVACSKKEQCIYKLSYGKGYYCRIPFLDKKIEVKR